MEVNLNGKSTIHQAGNVASIEMEAVPESKKNIAEIIFWLSAELREIDQCPLNLRKDYKLNLVQTLQKNTGIDLSLYEQKYLSKETVPQIDEEKQLTSGQQKQ
jgi:hypothetical protein